MLDYCDFCAEYRSKLNNSGSQEETKLIKESLNNHLDLAKKAREFYNFDKERVKSMLLESKYF